MSMNYLKNKPKSHGTGTESPSLSSAVRKEKLFRCISNSIDSQESYTFLNRPKFQLQDTYPTSIINNPVQNPRSTKVLKVVEKKLQTLKDNPSSSLNLKNKQLTAIPLKIKKSLSREKFISNKKGKTSLDIEKIWLNEFKEDFQEIRYKDTPRDELFKEVVVDDTLLNDTHMVFLNKVQNLRPLDPLFNKSTEFYDRIKNDKEKDNQVSRSAINDFYVVNKMSNSSIPGEILKSENSMQVLQKIIKNQELLTELAYENDRADLVVVSDMIIKMMGVLVEEYQENLRIANTMKKYKPVSNY